MEFIILQARQNFSKKHLFFQKNPRCTWGRNYFTMIFFVFSVTFLLFSYMLSKLYFLSLVMLEFLFHLQAIPKNNDNESIYFVYYKNNKFFVEKPKIEELCINGFTITKKRVYTPVITGDIVGQETQNLSNPVVLKFKAEEGVGFYSLTQKVFVFGF